MLARPAGKLSTTDFPYFSLRICFDAVQIDRTHEAF
jgi:hypothetical protein